MPIPGQISVEINTGMQRRINCPSIDKGKQLVGCFGAAEATGTDRKLMSIHPLHEQIGRKPQCLGQRRCSGAADILVADYVDCCGRVAERLCVL